MNDLLPFDIEVAKREPERVRHRDRTVPESIAFMGRCVVILWKGNDIPTVYYSFDGLRVLKKTRTIKVRLARYDGEPERILAWTEGYSRADWRKEPGPSGWTWIGEAFEREIPA